MDSVQNGLRTGLPGEFELVRPLGEGSFAEVFLAREAALDRLVAVKVLRPTLAADDTARRRFLREARLSAKIHHPNVVAVHRVGELEADGRPYLVMEYIDGRTAADALAATGPLEEDEVRRILIEVCGALDAAHQLGIIHRDVRPGNIMLSADGDRVVLTDFGLAGILESGSPAVTRLTQAGQMLGDLAHAPPEQLEGVAVQPSSDIYALAVTGYELLTGAGPFPDATSPAKRIRAHLSGDPTPVRRIRAGVSEALEDALLRCLHKRPEQRPSAALLRRRLEGRADAAAGDEDAFGSFLAELKRRRVYKVGAGYGAFVLVVLGIVDGALPALPFALPEWIDTAIVTATLAGFPLALILGWFYDVTAAGVRRTPTAGDAPLRMRLLQAAAITAALAAAAVAGWLFLSR